MSQDQPELRGLATLLQLEKEARHADSLERLGFVMVNDTRQLVRYHQAVLWRRSPQGRAEILNFSGLASPDRSSPYFNWLRGALTALSPGDAPGAARTVSADDLPERMREGWREWMPGPALWCPLVAPGGRWLGGLLLTREGAWQPSEIKLTERLCDAYAHAWEGLEKGGVSWRRRLLAAAGSRRTLVVSLAVLIGVMLLPVRQSALAPAQVTPTEPEVASAPVDGVVERIHVEPNAAVREGDLLFSLEDTQVRNRHEIAKRSLAVAEADYLRAAQKAFTDARSKSELALLKAKVDEKAAEADYTADLLERMQVRSHRAGIAVFADPNDWLGRPVSVGERVMLIADPARAELEIQLPVEDAINLEPGAEVLFFLNIRPTSPLPARLRRTAYEAETTPEGILAFRLKAAFEPDSAPPRIGLKGTAKVHGERVTLFYYLMRRPLSALRRTLGL